MAGTKTDNSYLDDKVFLRAGHLPSKDKIFLLDCYAGKGRIWKKVAVVSKARIMRLAIDFKDDVGFHLPGDNLAWMQSFDLSRFDVIDLDAYGVPYKQLKIILESGYRGVVFVTFIQSVFGVLPHEMLMDIGISQDMIEKCPTLFYRSGWLYFKNWLAMNGVPKIYHRSAGRKHYLCFSCAEESASDYDIQQAGTFANPS